MATRAPARAQPAYHHQPGTSPQGSGGNAPGAARLTCKSAHQRRGAAKRAQRAPGA